MQTRVLFQKISQRMRVEFDQTAVAVEHGGSKGIAREKILRDFLSKHLPRRYGFGSGEVVGRVRDETSNQTDLIIFDNLNGMTLFSDENVQVFPIESVYGIVEVKSALSKAEFVDALDKIKKFKALSPEGNVAHHLGGGLTMFHARPRPFGMVFAYGLADNSLDSLLENLRDWERDVSPWLWPNYVCVLESGNIQHSKAFENCIDSDQITKECVSVALSYGQDSLFQFFSSLHDICARMSLGPVELRHYYEPSERIGSHIVDIRPLTLTKDGEPPRQVRPSAELIEKIVSWSAQRGPMRYDELLQKRFGSVPIGMEKRANHKIFLYNPTNLPGMHEIEGPLLKMTENGATPTQPCLLSVVEFTIDGQLYALPFDAVAPDDFEDLN